MFYQLNILNLSFLKQDRQKKEIQSEREESEREIQINLALKRIESRLDFYVLKLNMDDKKVKYNTCLKNFFLNTLP